MSVSVHVYRHWNLQVKYRDFIKFTKILKTFCKSVNGSVFPVAAAIVLGPRGIVLVVCSIILSATHVRPYESCYMTLSKEQT